jgi:hypothetical protein
MAAAIRLKQEHGFSPILEGQTLRRAFARVHDPIRLAHTLPPDERRRRSLVLVAKKRQRGTK